MLWVVVLCAVATPVAASIAQDKIARDAICSAYGGGALIGWCSGGPSAPVCDETGITCDGGGNVVEVVVSDAGAASAQLPTEMGLFFNLRSLSFSLLDTINAPFPTEIGNLQQLTALEFFLINSLPALPSEIGRLSLLTRLELSLATSTAVDFLPTEIGQLSALRILLLNYVHMTSATVPATIANLNQLNTLGFGVVSFAAPFPTVGLKPALNTFILAYPGQPVTLDDPALFQSPQLEVVSLGGPNLAGSIPDTIGQATSLFGLVLDTTAFTGTVPSSLRALSALTHLQLSDNVGITGTLPTSLETLTSLQYIAFYGNSLSGSFPAVSPLAPVDTFDVHSDGNCAASFSGPLHQSVVDMANALPMYSFDISQNCFSGTIPATTVSHANRAPSYFLFQINGNYLVDPLPDWLLEIYGDLRFAGVCAMDDNLFCFEPTPYLDYGRHCSFSLDGAIDQCGVCEGSSDTCDDCAGVTNGSGLYDTCDVCNGDGMSCVDCDGVPNGPRVYDSCDVCGGNDASLDCAGVCFGTSEADVCGVCDGDGLSCLDCSGVPNGSFEYDACDVCGGDDSTCIDCAGVYGGTQSYDLCGVCADVLASDYRPACLDCNGTAFGTAVLDACGVCGGANACVDAVDRGIAGTVGIRRYWPWFIVTIVVFVIATALCLFIWRPRARRTRRAAAAATVPAAVGPSTNPVFARFANGRVYN